MAIRNYFRVLSLSAVFLAPGARGAEEFILSLVLAGMPPAPSGETEIVVTVPPGEVWLPVDVVLTTRGLPPGEGPQAWSLGLANDPCMRLQSVSLKGLTVSTIYDQDEDRDPATPPIHLDPYVQDLGGRDMFTAVAAPAVPFGEVDRLPEDPGGAISFAVLRGREKMTLHANASDAVLRMVFRISVAQGETTECAVRFREGMVSEHSMWTRNAVTYLSTSQPLTFQGLVVRLTGSGIVDATVFIRGDSNSDGLIDLSDAVAVLGFLFQHAPEVLPCKKAADCDGSGELDVTDGIYLINHLFLGGPRPKGPFPWCGTDGEPGGLPCEGFGACL